MVVLSQQAPPTAPGLQLSANDILASAMRLIGVLASGETLDAAISNDALAILNQMVDSWSAERLLIFTIQRQVFSLVIGQQVYGVGPGGDFNIARPPRIERIGIINLSNQAQPLELPMEMLDDVGWEGIPVKNITTTLPRSVWNDQGFPLMNLSYYPIPSAAVNTALYTWTALSQFLDLVTQFTFPPAYAKALRYNLAVDLAPEFGRALASLPEVAAQSVSTKAVIKSINSRFATPQMTSDPALVSRTRRQFNWITGEAGGSGRGTW